MSVSAKLIYRHPGIHIPYTNAGLAAGDWWTIDPRITQEGFIYVDSLGNDKVLLVQSVTTGELFINKIIRDADFSHDLPYELRVSTAPEADCPIPLPNVVDGKPRRQFDELVAWQWFDDGTYSMYFRYCNGGTLQNLITKYHEQLRPVPESFIWLVLERICEIVRYFHLGAVPGEYGQPPPAQWSRISHRDCASNNIFIHYQPPRRGHAPRAGLEMNAFPDIVIGDFGESSLIGDDPVLAANGIFGIPFNMWEDMVTLGSSTAVANLYFFGECLRQMAQAHIPDDPNDIDRTNEILINTVNARMPPGELHYSNDLINMLEEFEYPGGAGAINVLGNHVNAAGVVVPNYQTMPSIFQITTQILPLARRKVRRYRGPVVPRPVGYYDRIDVSWTRPQRIMPYEYLGVPAAPAPLIIKKGKQRHQCPVPESEIKRRKLRHVSNWHHIRPHYKVASLQYSPVTMTAINDDPPPAPYPPAPPGGNSSSSSAVSDTDSD